MVDYRLVAAEWVEQSPYGEGIDPEAVHAVYEHCQWLDYSGGRESVRAYLRGLWMRYSEEFVLSGFVKGESAEWMVQIEKMASSAV